MMVRNENSLFQNNLKLTTEIFEFDLTGVPFGNNRITAVGSELMIAGTKKFTYQPFDPITDNRITHLATDRQAEPAGPGSLMLYYKNKKMGRMYLAPHFLTLQEILPIFKSVCSGKSLPAPAHP